MKAFSQAETDKHSLIQGIAFYDCKSEDVDMDAGNAVESTISESFSIVVVSCAKLHQTPDGSQESTNNDS